MRKLSMKNAGTPAIEEDSDSGSGGVSAEGLGARFPRLSFAGEPPLAPCSAPVFALPLVRPAGAAGLVPWALCPLTCGVAVVVCGALGAGAGAGVAVDSLGGVGAAGGGVA